MNFLNEEFLKYQKKIGQEFGPTDWIQITQNKIDEFAHLTQDPQFIHIDPIKAKQNSPFRKTIAHGFLVFSFASKNKAPPSDITRPSRLVSHGLLAMFGVSLYLVDKALSLHICFQFKFKFDEVKIIVELFTKENYLFSY